MKKILILLLMLLISGQTVFAAQKTPIKIVPAENISTCYDEIQTGDKLLFQVKNDVYVDKQLIFKKGANVIVRPYSALRLVLNAGVSWIPAFLFVISHYISL